MVRRNREAELLPDSVLEDRKVQGEDYNVLGITIVPLDTSHWTLDTSN